MRSLFLLILLRIDLVVVNIKKAFSYFTRPRGKYGGRRGGWMENSTPFKKFNLKVLED